MPISSSSSLDLPRHASPPQSQQPLLRKYQPNPPSSSSSSSSLLRILSVAIFFVLAFHWYLVLHHVQFHAPHHHRHAFLESSIVSGKRWGGSSSSRTGSKQSSQGGGDGKDAYILSPVCGGCYRAYNSANIPCFDLIQQYIKEHNGTSIEEASRMVGRDVKECSLCNPDTCYTKYSIGNNNEKYQTKYWRFDQTSPKISHPTSLVLPSIPQHMRIPPTSFPDDKIEAYIRKVYAHPDPENTTHVFLNEYNPGLAPIPDSLRPYLPWNARYVLSLRVTPHNFCFGVWLTEALTEEIKQTMHSLNHLGLALLDENYQIVEGYDVVIDIDKQLDAKRDSYMGEPAFVDYRLFTMNDALYLHINSDTVILTKLKLRSKGMKSEADEEEEEMLKKKRKRGEDDPIQLTNLYGGDKLEVTLVHQFNTIWGEGKESIFGKNYALFTLPSTTTTSSNNRQAAPDSVYAEMSVYPEHRVQQILPEKYEKLPRDRRIKWRQRRNFKIDHVMQRRMEKVNNATRSEASLVPSFFNADEHWFPGGKNPFKEFTHGGACCVRVSLEQIGLEESGRGWIDEMQKNIGVEFLMVGVGHTLVKYYNKKKLPPSERMLIPDTNYVSFFYAFLPRSPFPVLVKSGYFCLGFASTTSPEDEGGTLNPRSILTHNRPLQQNNETFACPQIHYVETIIEKVGDESKVVVGYGMNDCTARLVEVEKSEIVSLLFPDPLDMVISSADE